MAMQSGSHVLQKKLLWKFQGNRCFNPSRPNSGRREKKDKFLFQYNFQKCTGWEGLSNIAWCNFTHSAIIRSSLFYIIGRSDFEANLLRDHCYKLEEYSAHLLIINMAANRDSVMVIFYTTTIN